MDTKYKSHSFVKLWIATTIFILCCFTTDMSAQNAAAADTVAAVTETITEVVAAPDRKSTRLNSSHKHRSRMPSSA